MSKRAMTEKAKLARVEDILDKTREVFLSTEYEKLNPLPAEAGRFWLRLKSQFRLKPVAMRLKPAEALRIVGYVEPVIARFILLFNVFFDNTVRHCSRRSAEITPSPKMLAP